MRKDKISDHNLNVLRLNRLKKEKVTLEKAIKREHEFLEKETRKEFPDFKLEEV